MTYLGVLVLDSISGNDARLLTNPKKNKDGIDVWGTVIGVKNVVIQGVNSFWTLKLSTTLGVDVVDADRFKIYPNPTDQILNMEMPFVTNESTQIVDLT